MEYGRALHISEDISQEMVRVGWKCRFVYEKVS
jgi:hypothetical protein